MSRQSSGRMWSSTSSTLTAPSRWPSSSTTGTVTRLYVASSRVTRSSGASGDRGSTSLSITDPAAQGRGQLGPADDRKCLGDRGLRSEYDRLCGHQAARGLLVVRQQPPQWLGLVRLHQAQEVLGRLVG